MIDRIEGIGRSFEKRTRHVPWKDPQKDLASLGLIYQSTKGPQIDKGIKSHGKGFPGSFLWP
jgi:hypothetical protein